MKSKRISTDSSMAEYFLPPYDILAMRHSPEIRAILVREQPHSERMLQHFSQGRSYFIRIVDIVNLVLVEVLIGHKQDFLSSQPDHTITSNSQQGQCNLDPRMYDRQSVWTPPTLDQVVGCGLNNKALRALGVTYSYLEWTTSWSGPSCATRVDSLSRVHGLRALLHATNDFPQRYDTTCNSKLLKQDEGPRGIAVPSLPGHLFHRPHKIQTLSRVLGITPKMPKKDVKNFIDDIPNDRLSRFPTSQTSLYHDDYFRCNMQGVSGNLI